MAHRKRHSHDGISILALPPHNVRTVHGSRYTFSVKPNRRTDVFWFLVARSSGRLSAFVHVALSRTLYGKSSKALRRFRGDLVACTRQAVRGGRVVKSLSVPMHISRVRDQSRATRSVTRHCTQCPPSKGGPGYRWLVSPNGFESLYGYISI